MLDPEEVKNWLQKAENDFQGALDLSRRRKRPLPDLVCFHCQQAVEKYMKALLVYNEIGFPKTHDLLMLLTLIQPANPQLTLHREWFEILNPYSVQFRYPGDQTNNDEARLAIKTVKKIRKLLLNLFPPALTQKIKQ